MTGGQAGSPVVATFSVNQSTIDNIEGMFGTNTGSVTLNLAFYYSQDDVEFRDTFEMSLMGDPNSNDQNNDQNDGTNDPTDPGGAGGDCSTQTVTVDTRSQMDYNVNLDTNSVVTV
jgi:hypothetical protein